LRMGEGCTSSKPGTCPHGQQRLILSREEADDPETSKVSILKKAGVDFRDRRRGVPSESGSWHLQRLPKGSNAGLSLGAGNLLKA
jgi:hypothetical protein